MDSTMGARKEGKNELLCEGMRVERDERKRRTPKITGHEPNHGPPRNLGSIIRATHFGKQWSPWNAARAGAFGAEVHERPVGRKVHEL